MTEIKQKTNHCIQVTEDVYWKLVEMKFEMRVHSVDTVLRDIMGLPSNNDAPVKIYSSDDGVSASARAPAEPGTHSRKTMPGSVQVTDIRQTEFMKDVRGRLGIDS